MYLICVSNDVFLRKWSINLLNIQIIPIIHVYFKWFHSNDWSIHVYLICVFNDVFLRKRLIDQSNHFSNHSNNSSSVFSSNGIFNLTFYWFQVISFKWLIDTQICVSNDVFLRKRLSHLYYYFINLKCRSFFDLFDFISRLKVTI